MDKYAELIRAMSEVSLTLVKELNEALRRKELAYDDLCVTYDVLFEEHEELESKYAQATDEAEPAPGRWSYSKLCAAYDKICDERDRLESNYCRALDDVDNLTKRLRKYEKEDT